MDLSDIPPPLPPFDWRNVYADPIVAFYAAGREDEMRGLTHLVLGLHGPFTPEMYERALSGKLQFGCVLFDDDKKVAKAGAKVMQALVPYIFGQ